MNENETIIVINVKDVNDMPPSFPQQVYERTMNEELAVPFPIMQVVPHILGCVVVVVIVPGAY